MNPIDIYETNTPAENVDVIERCGFELDAPDELDGETVWRSVAEGNGKIVIWTEVLDGVLHLAVGDSKTLVAWGYIPAGAAVAVVVEGDREQYLKRIRWHLTD